MKFATVFFLTFLVSSALLSNNKKTLSYDELLSWNRINSYSISNNGKYVVYEYSPVVGDSKTVIYNCAEEKNDSIQYAKGYQLSPESNFVLFYLKTPYDSIRNCKIKKVDKKKMPKDSVGILVFGADSLIKFPKVKNFKVGKDEGFWAAILLEKDAFEKKKEEVKDTATVEPTEPTEPTEPIEEAEIAEEKVKEEAKEEKKPEKQGDVLLLFNSINGDTITFQSVTEYTISEKGGRIAFITEYKDSLLRSNVVLFDMNNSKADSIFSLAGKVKKLTFDKTGSQLAFIGSTDTTDVKTYSVFYSKEKVQPSLVVDTLSHGMPEGFAPSEHGSLSFSDNGEMLFLGTAPKPVDESNDSIPADDIPKLDVWSWTDLKLQSQQKIDLKKDKNKTYTAVWHVKKNKLVQLATEHFADLSTTSKKNSEFALLRNELPYLRETNWTGQWCKDLAVINLKTGESKAVSKKQHSSWLSAGGNYIVWYNSADTCFYSYSIGTEKTVNLTANIPVKFYNEEEDHPILPNTYGIAGWSTNDKYLLLYDRYDIWKIDPSGNEKAINLTLGLGRNAKIEYRIIDLDKENEFIPLDDNLLLKAKNEENNDEYYCSINLKKDKAPKQLFGGAYYLATPQKAKNADRLLWSLQNFQTYPDLIVSDQDFNKPKTISTINPQQDEYNWGTVEAVEWTSFRNEKLKGLLYKPENFDPEKEYPMIVYFYERDFGSQHRHNSPSPSRSIINKTFYTSNGYLVFDPDITYIDGYPGQSAYDAIISGVNYLTSTCPFINPKKMALQGQSWGGYQTAYLITRTDLFAAAMAGAPVSNMTSAYGGIRWETGLNRMFQYEKTQSRIGGSLWEKPMQYIENSPLFYAPKVNTPLLMMHNDNDGAVPWYQGIEFFVALRRLDKPAWLLSYNDEPHNLKAESWANRLDLSKRMKQFFDHYLKDEPAPKWMLEGLPATKKGIELGY